MEYSNILDLLIAQYPASNQKTLNRSRKSAHTTVTLSYGGRSQLFAFLMTVFAGYVTRVEKVRLQQTVCVFKLISLRVCFLWYFFNEQV